MLTGAAAFGGALLAPAVAQALGKAPAPSLPSRPRQPVDGLYRVELAWGGQTNICGVRFQRLLIVTPDPPVARAARLRCHNAGIRRAVIAVSRRFANCSYLRDSNRVQRLEAEVGRELTRYFRGQASSRIAPVRVSFVQVPPPAPAGRPDRPVRLGGVPPRPLHRGCGRCATSEDGAGSGVGLGFLGSALVALGVIWRRRRGGGDE